MTDGAGATTAAALHQELVALVHALERRIDDARTASEVAVLSEQIRAANRRATAAGAMAMVHGTEALSAATAAVRAAIPPIVEAIEDADRMAATARQLSAALALVDHALGTAKLLGRPPSPHPRRRDRRNRSDPRGGTRATA